MRITSTLRPFILAILCGFLASCTEWPMGQPQQDTPNQTGQSNSQPIATYSQQSFAALEGWQTDRFEDALKAQQLSCRRLLSLPPERSLGADGRMGTAGDWRPFCQQAITLNSGSAYKTLIETQLRPWQVSSAEQSNGLFTGYYESSLRGSRTRHGAYQTPLYRRPANLVMVDLGLFRDELKGQRIAGTVEGGALKPYANRSQITSQGLEGKTSPLVWVDNPIDAFFLEIQGSGRITLDNGDVLRVGYDGQNGHPYLAIGKVLVERGALQPTEVSMQSIRAWLTNHPTQAQELMNKNPSYVFFRALSDLEGPEGAARVALTPLRSLAIDNRFIGYHVPIWLAAENVAGTSLNRLMLAQDTGGAIRGVVRGDVFWGYGQKAEEAAGIMKARGTYSVLLPLAIDPRR